MLKNPTHGIVPVFADGSSLLFYLPRSCSISPMTDKQVVIDAPGRLPENASPGEIIKELLATTALRRGRANIAADRTKTHYETEHWPTPWTTP
jgi:hypothetical protein